MKELKAELKKRNLKISGNKQTLQVRLQESVKNDFPIDILYQIQSQSGRKTKEIRYPQYSHRAHTGKYFIMNLYKS